MTSFAAFGCIRGTRRLQALLAWCCLAAAVHAEEPRPVRVLFVGDVMLDWGVGEVLREGKDPLADFALLFEQADVAVGNLECVASTVGEPVAKRYRFRADPAFLPVLARHFTAVGVANNHTGDFGPAAFLDTLTRLEQAGLPAFGGGRNRTGARRPFVVERQGLRIAVLGYNEYPPESFEATEDRPGTAWSHDAQVMEDIRLARLENQAYIVIPFLHWGKEYVPFPTERQRTLARAMIDAGADAVVGAHPHCTQGTEIYRGKPVVYSLGNFVFNDDETDPAADVGWALRLAFDSRGLVAWDTVTARIDDRGVPFLDAGTASPAGRRGDAEARPARPDITRWPGE